MNFLQDIYNTLMPETIIIATILICVLTSFLIKENKQKLNYTITIFGLLASFISIGLTETDFFSSFYNSFISTHFTSFFKALVLIGTILCCFMSKKQSEIWGTNAAEYYILLLCATLGALILTGSNDLITMFIGVETLGLCSYALSGYTKKDVLSNEAALKYLVFGGTATAITLYGLSFLYGITGTTNFFEIAHKLSYTDTNSILILSSIMVISGIGFKLSLAPFHRWTPDVYQGAPIPVAAYLSVVSKIAGFAVLTRIIALHFINIETTSLVLMFIATLTMSTGNLMAIGQSNVKRLLAYSSIAQAGYIVAGLAVLTKLGLAASIFYIITYLFMNIGAWAGIEIIINKTGNDNIEAFGGLAKKYPLLAGAISICFISLAGIPIAAGFFSKFFLFNAILFSGKFIFLIICLINTVIGLYYYLKVIKVMFLDSEIDNINNTRQIKDSVVLNSVLLTCTFAVIVIGLYASPFINFSKYIAIKNDGQSNYAATHRLNSINKK